MKKILIISCATMLLACTSGVTFASDVGKEKVPKTASFDMPAEHISDAVTVAIHDLMISAGTVVVNSTADVVIIPAVNTKTEKEKTTSFIPYSMAYLCTPSKSDYKIAKLHGSLRYYSEPDRLIDMWKNQIKQC